MVIELLSERVEALEKEKIKSKKIIKLKTDLNEK